MSDPIRAQFEEDEATQDSRWPAEATVQTNAMNPETGAEDEQASGKPPVVRTLKPPPEIWDMVHEAPEHFNPGGAFVARLTSTKTNLVLLTLTVIFISGLCAYAIMTLSDGTRGSAAAQVQEEPGASQTAPATQADAPASAPASTLNNATDAQLNTSPGAEYSVDNPQPTDSQTAVPEPADPLPTDQGADNTATAGHAVTGSIQPTGVSVSNISKRAASGAAGALSGIKPVTVASGDQNADRSRPPRRESETAAAPDTTALPKTVQTAQPPQTPDIKRSDEKSSGDSASAKKGSDTTSSPQANAPPSTSSAPKAKVIQWP